MAFIFSMTFFYFVIAYVQLGNAKPQSATSAVAASHTPYNNYPFLNPFSNCPDYLNWPPYYYYCECNFYYCLDVAIQAQVEAIAAQYGIDLCSAQQWAILIENGMPGIDHLHETAMLTDLSDALRTEMNSRGLAFVDPPTWCTHYAHTLPSAHHVPGVAPSVAAPSYAPALVKRSPQMSPTTAAAAPYSPTSLSMYASSMDYLLRNALPYVSPELQNSIENAIYNNTPHALQPYADDLIDELQMNMRAMVSEMFDYDPYTP